MMKAKTIILFILALLNCVVLLGQLWPEGAPPFARIVTILFLLSSFIYFIIQLVNKK